MSSFAISIQGDSSLQQLLRFGHTSLRVETQGRHIQEQRMLEPVRQSRLGHDGRFRMRAALCGRVNCAQSCVISFRIASGRRTHEPPS